MKRTTKIIIVVSLGAAAVVVLLFMAFSYKENHYHVCSTCYTLRFRDKWWLGYYVGPRITVWSREVIRQTHINKDFFTPDHEHNWAFAHSYCHNVFRFFQTYARYASGRGPVINDFVGFYETFPAFRDFIQAQIAEGKLTQDQVCKIVELPSGVFQDQNSPAGNSELAIKARRIFDEFNKM